ncbi:MAG: Rieske (2Fe-2S) protein [Vicinamibacterales bacterium]
MNRPGVAADRSDRRRFFSRIVIGVQALIGSTIGAVVAGAALAPSLASRATRWQRATSLADLSDGEPTPVTLRLIRRDGYRQVVDRRVVYVRRDDSGGVLVLDSTCTHLGCRTKYDPASKHFVCPCHGGVYDSDGAVLAGPPPAPLRRLEARVEGDRIEVQV